MTGEGNHVGGGDDLAMASSKGKVKFLCSHGGKILIRPTDGHLKYVGGETRVIGVARHITFLELMKKLTGTIGGNMMLKYQLMPEDLETLVTVRTDEDLKHMIDEHDRHESEGTPRLRTFLFPAPVKMVENSAATTLEPHALEQRYLDAINGVTPSTPTARLSPIKALRASSTSSSPGSLSPLRSRPAMHRVQSSPSVTYLHHSHSHPCHQHDGPQTSRLPPDLPSGGGMGKFSPAFSTGRAAANPFSRHYKNRHHGGRRTGCSQCAHYDEDGVASCPQSPRTVSPRHIFWD